MTQLLLKKPEASAFIMLVVMMIVFTFLSPAFLTYANLQIVLQPIPEIALIAIGVTILMIAGEFDLSVGSVFALSPMVMVLCMAAGLPLPLAMVVGLFAAVVVGLINAFITLRIGLPSFIATLGMLFMARSIAIVMSGGFPPPFPRDLNLWWIVGKFDLLRVSVFWLLGIGMLLGFWLRRFDFGNWIFATGGNREAARDMGINTTLVKTLCFVLCSLLAGFAGMIQTFRIQAIVPTMGTGFELTAIAAAVIGGAALTGGIGSVTGAVIGALLIAFIENIIILTRIDANWFRFAVGAMIVISVAVNKFTRDMAASAKRKETGDD
ncbi:ABC transporter permease [Paracoccus sp. (in: a-proteobacteria)]|uniref:ABC transporter permease n=1 Tax=Paracoccus sp. TaxID=267 RepID=UPI003A86486C